jgi:hypothetical protein
MKTPGHPYLHHGVHLNVRPLWQRFQAYNPCPCLQVDTPVHNPISKVIRKANRRKVDYVGVEPINFEHVSINNFDRRERSLHCNAFVF